MSKVQRKFLEKYAELSESHNKSDVEDNPSDVLESGMATAIVALENDDSSDADELSKQEEIRQQQARITENVFGNSSSSSSKQKASLDSYDRHTATGSTETVESSNEEELSENDKDEVSKLQADLAERIFSS